jgi:hypothetical protein
MAFEGDALSFWRSLPMAKNGPTPDPGVQARLRANLLALEEGRKRKDLAKDVGISAPYLTQLLDGKRPIPLDWTPHFARALKVSLDRLLFDDLSGKPIASKPSTPGGLDVAASRLRESANLTKLSFDELLSAIDQHLREQTASNRPRKSRRR